MSAEEVREDVIDLVVPPEDRSDGWFPETEGELEEGLRQAIARRVVRLYVRRDVERLEVE